MTTARAFVTGSTGLLGNNLVRELLDRGFAVRALVRSRAKAELQFDGVPRGMAAGQLEIVEGDLANVAAFASSCHPR
jgi:dihydroflavonol-4-reductase